MIAGWVPWSAGDAARYGTKLAAAAELRRALDEAGFVIVPRVASEPMMHAARDWSSVKYGKPIGKDASDGCWNVMIQESQR